MDTSSISFRSRIIKLLISTCISAIGWLPLYAEEARESPALTFSALESAWLADHPLIEIGVDGNWPPIDFMESGEHRGIAADYLQILSQRLGVEFRVHPGPTFKQMLERVRQGQLPMAASVVKNPEREQELFFSEPFFKVHKAIVTRLSRDDISGIRSLYGKVVAVEDGFSTMAQLQQVHPEIILLPVQDTREALQAVAWNRADAYVGTRTVAQWLIEQEQLVNLHFSGDSGIGSSEQRFAIHRDSGLEPLVGLLNKGLGSITPQEHREILQRWIRSPTDRPSGEAPGWLTLEQREWLKQRGPLRIGIDTAWEPIEYVDDQGRYQGISSDYLEYIARQLNIAYEVTTDLTWSEVLESARAKQLDLLPALVNTPERSEYLEFTQAYLDFPFVLFVDEKHPFVNGLGDFSGKTVGVVKGYVAEEYLKRDFPDIVLIPLDNALEGLQRLSLGEIEGYLGNLTVGSHLIRKHGLTNIKVGAPTPYEYKLSIGVRKDWPILVDLIDRVIKEMPERNKSQIMQRWMSLRYDVAVDYRVVWQVIGIALCILLGLGLWMLQIRRKHKQARRNETQLDMIINTLPVAVVVSDRQGVIRMANRQSLREVEARDQTVIGMNMGAFYAYADDRERVLKALQRHRAVQNMRLTIKTLPGNHIEGLLSVIPIHLHNEEMNLGVMVNLTERIRIENELKKAMALSEQTSRFKSDFLANMSHEIRTPMNAIIGMTHLAMDTELTQKQSDYLSKIRLSAINLLGIINDILDFSKIEAGKLEIEQSEFKLDSVLENLASLVSLKSEQKGIELIFSVDHQLPQVLIGDPLRIGQVLLNLTQNAIKFTAQGEILISVTLNGPPGDLVNVRFSVRDTGIGIDPEQLEQLFDAFVQADASTTRRHGGTGLGLSISQNLVELMSGQMQVESRPGEGSLFEFTLPLKVGSSEVMADRSSDNSLQDLRVLVVEDNATARDVLSDMLQSFSFRVTAVSSAGEAYRVLEKDRLYGLILLDWRMPGTDGIEAATHIRSRIDTEGEIPLLLVTAHDREGLVERAHKAGFDGVLIKPVNPSTLLDTIYSVIRGQYPALPARQPRMRRFKGQVLVVEDNPINQQVARELLEKLGLLVVVVNSGEEALARISETQFDLVFMDLQMPGIDGLETTRRVRNEMKNTYLRIIAMTAHAMQGDRERCLAAGMDDYLSKPIDPDKLSRLLLAWLPVDDNPLVEAKPSDTQSPEPSFPESVRGIDPHWGVKRVGGNRQLYMKLLSEFQQRYHDSSDQVLELLRLNQKETLKRLLHTLQGVSGNIGAGGLQQASRMLMEALIGGEDESVVMRLHEQFDRQATQVFNSIQQLKDGDSDQLHADNSSAAGEQAITDLIEQLSLALDQGDVRAGQLLGSLAPLIRSSRPRMSDQMGILEAHVENYDFTQAARDLQLIREQLERMNDDIQE